MTPHERTTTRTHDPAAVIRAWLDAFNDRSHHAAARRLLHDDLHFVNEGFGFEARGPAAWVASNDRFLAAVPDFRIEMTDYDVDGETVRFQMRMHGTFTGTLETAEGPVTGTGKAFTFGVDAEATVPDGRIRRWTSRFDGNEVYRRMGIAPAR